ncbi:MAG: YgaP family membrane protein [Bdellovibrionota bacterium]
MNRNVGNADRIARTLLGLGILSLAFVGPQTAWGYLGLIPLGTAAWGFCPLYRFLGFST